MDEKKNIDRLFQEKFKDFEAVPDAEVWNNIERQFLKKKKRRIIPLWLRFGGAAAILLLLISTGFWYFNENDNTIEPSQENSISDIDSKDEIIEETSSDKEENAITFDEQEEKTDLNYQKEEDSKIKNNQSRKDKTKLNSFAKQLNNTEKEAKIASYEKENSVIESNVNKDANQRTKEKIIGENANIVLDNSKNKLNSDEIVVAQEETIDQPEKAKDVIQEELEKAAEENELVASTTNKWSIGSTMSPIYYNTLGNGSPIDPTLATNKKNSNESISYGLKVNYRLSKKLSLQSGINTVELGYSTENVAALISSSLLSGSNTNVNSNVEGISVAAVSTANSQNSDVINQRSSFDSSGNLDQTLGYVEIPLEAKYNILQKKLGINLIGGFSTYFLYQNKVSITSFGKTTTLGEASNINTLNFSGNLGVDFDYNISKKIYINVSPMFKYQLNTFSENSGGFQPYYLGVYTGLNFRF